MKLIIAIAIALTITSTTGSAETITVRCTPTIGFGGVALNGQLHNGLTDYYIHNFEFNFAQMVVQFGRDALPISYDESRISFVWYFNGAPNTQWIFDRITGKYATYAANGPAGQLFEAGTCENVQIERKF